MIFMIAIFMKCFYLCMANNNYDNSEEIETTIDVAFHAFVHDFDGK